MARYLMSRLAVTTLVSVISLASPAAQFKFSTQALTVPDGFEVELVAGDNLVPRPISLAYDELGRLYVTDSSGSNEKFAEQLEKQPHRVMRLEDIDGDGRFDRSRVFADKLMFPEGAMWLDGSLYVGAPPSIWKLTDTDGDGIADKREEWHQGKTLNGCANDVHVPYLGPDGWIYWCKGVFEEQTYEIHGKPFTTKASHIFRSRPDHTEMEAVLTGGMDNPVGIAFSPTGERFLAGTFFEPGGGKRDGVIHAIYGGVYGKPHPEVLDQFKKTGELLPVMIHLGPSASCSVRSYRSLNFGIEFRHNLFVCNFNLHNVTRHVLQPAGATYDTKDSVFLSSDNPDFHPTDLLEDADGSLLVVDTGGWYKICCPTSQLSKPDVLGAIYRIRKAGAPKIQDPRGLSIKWETLHPAELTQLLANERPYVVDRAIQQLAKCKNESVPALTELLNKSKSVETRRNAVWAGTQINTPASRSLVRRALSDQDETIRGIALHSISLWRDGDALPQLIELLNAGSPSLRRASAEAIGRIEAKSAVPALLKAAAKPTDRFGEHSLTYALIEIGDPIKTASGLEASSAETRRSALIALDQMENGDLKSDRVTPLLGPPEPVLKRTASWIVSHHNDWGGALAEFFRGRIALPDLSGADTAELINQMAQFAHATAVQNVLSETLQSNIRAAQRTALTVIAQANLKEAPAAWGKEVVPLLAMKDADMLGESVLAALSLSPKSKELSAALTQISGDETIPAEVRLNALSAGPNGMTLENRLFGFTIEQVAPAKPVKIRSLATTVLLRAKLTEAQLLTLSEALKTAGPLELGRLLGAFDKSTAEAVGMQLIADLQAATAVSSLRSEQLKPLFGKYSATVQAKAEPLVASLNVDAAKQSAHLEDLLTSVTGGDLLHHWS